MVVAMLLSFSQIKQSKFIFSVLMLYLVAKKAFLLANISQTQRLKRLWL